MVHVHGARVQRQLEALGRFPLSELVAVAVDTGKSSEAPRRDRLRDRVPARDMADRLDGYAAVDLGIRPPVGIQSPNVAS